MKWVEWYHTWNTGHYYGPPEYTCLQDNDDVEDFIYEEKFNSGYIMEDGYSRNLL